MVHTTITPLGTDVHITVPQDYVGKKVEVLLYASDEVVEGTAPVKKNTMAKFWGVISPETGEEMHKSANESRNEWDRDI